MGKADGNVIYPQMIGKYNKAFYITSIKLFQIDSGKQKEVLAYNHISKRQCYPEVI